MRRIRIRPLPDARSPILTGAVAVTAITAFLGFMLWYPGVGATPFHPANSLFLTGGTLIDLETGSARVANLLIRDGVIAGTPESPPRHFAGRILDISGRYVIPGLRDLHVHSMVNAPPAGPPERLGSDVASRRMAQTGVVGFLDLLHVEPYIFPMRDRQRAGDGADIFAAGAVLTAPGGHGTEYGLPARLVTSPEDARRHVAELAELGADAVKIVYEHPTAGTTTAWRREMPTLDRASLDAAIDAARQHCLRSIVHIRSWQDVREVAEAGADAFTHLPSPPMPDGLEAELAATRIVAIPTLARGDLSLRDPEQLDDPMLRLAAGDALLGTYRDWSASPPEWAAGMIAGLGEAQANRLDALRRLHDAGVMIVAGSDSGNPWTLHGVALHRELELMVEAGLSPADALRAATVDAGRFLRRSWRLHRGNPGSLVVLDGSPLDDITNTRRIVEVVHHGRLVDRAAWHPAADLSDILATTDH